MSRRGAQRIRGWWARLRSDDAPRPADGGPVSEARATFARLHGALDGSALANGVIELVIDDTIPAERCLLDIHDGQVTAIDPGSAVPWASVSGSSAAWSSALGLRKDTSQLRPAGEPHLVDGLLAALRSTPLCLDEDEHEYSVVDCS